MAHWMKGMLASGVTIHQEKPDRTKVQTPSVQQAKEAFELAVVKCNRPNLDAKLLTQDPIKQRYIPLRTFHLYGAYGFLVENKTAFVELEESYGGEAALTQAIEEYDFHVDGPVHKETGSKVDVFRTSNLLAPLLLRFGALRSYETWLNKTLKAFQEIGPFAEYAAELHEVSAVGCLSGAPIAVMCGFEDDARRILAATGLIYGTHTNV